MGFHCSTWQPWPGSDEGVLASEGLPGHQDVSRVGLLERSHQLRRTLFLPLVLNAETDHDLAVLLGPLQTLGQMVTSHVVRLG